MEGIVFVLNTTWWLLKMVWTVWFFVYPLLLPILLGYFIWTAYLIYQRAKSYTFADPVLLEIRLPQEIIRSPLSTELFLNALYQTSGETNWWKRYVMGRYRAWFSLEIASLGGELHFFIWVQGYWKDHVEAQIYAQYPEVEVHEAKDYMLTIPWNLEGYEFWGNYMRLMKHDIFPISTYMDFNMTDQTGEDAKDMIEPLSPTLELMSNIGPKEQMWLQIVIRSHRRRREFGDIKNKWFGWKIVGEKKVGARTVKTYKEPSWQDEGKTEIERLASRTKKTISQFGEFDVPTQLNEQEQRVVKAIERNISKYGFDTILRLAYVAEEGNMNAAVASLVFPLRQFGSNTLNSIAISAATDYDFPWEDPFGRKNKENNRIFLELMKRRGGFYDPFIQYDYDKVKSGANRRFVLSSESLASIWHPPAGYVSGPMYGGTVSKKSEPPANLPINKEA